MAESKKAWVEPELIVLVRSKPEEAVLGACRIYGVNESLGYSLNGCDSFGCGGCVTQDGS